ncbi:hypothetical protein [Microvirga sp. VF16]|uniref:hypothetical protein n=1 Tax=Microvirga sp. VF16 TaxID=2807101 RepID=UPI00353009BB
MPGYIGVAAGAFADPTFPAPTISAWEQSKHPWVSFGHKALHLQGQRPPLGLKVPTERYATRSPGPNCSMKSPPPSTGPIQVCPVLNP